MFAHYDDVDFRIFFKKKRHVVELDFFRKSLDVDFDHNNAISIENFIMSNENKFEIITMSNENKKYV